MSKQTSIYQPKGYSFQAAQFAPADTSTAKQVALPGSDDSVVKALLITSTDTADRKVSIIVNDGSQDFVLDTVDVPAGSGTNGTAPAVDALGNAALPLDASAKKVLPLMQGTTLKAAITSTITAAKVIQLSAILQDF